MKLINRVDRKSGVSEQSIFLSYFYNFDSIIKITKGNFRLIHRLFAQIDRILRINQIDKITVEVVEAARDSLVIGI